MIYLSSSVKEHIAWLFFPEEEQPLEHWLSLVQCPGQDYLVVPTELIMITTARVLKYLNG